MGAMGTSGRRLWLAPATPQEVLEEALQRVRMDGPNYVVDATTTNGSVSPTWQRYDGGAL